MNPRKLFEENLPLIERVIAHVSRKGRLIGADAENFASSAHLALMQNDYAVLAQYDGRAALGTYLAVVLQRFLCDERNRQFGRWRPSAAARRMGDAGLLLEKLLQRDRRSLPEIAPIVTSSHRTLTAADVESMAARLPPREQRLRAVILDDVPDCALPSTDDAACRVDEDECRRLSALTACTLRTAMAAMTAEERVLLKMRFGSSMNISAIARMLRIPQRPLYRRIESLLARLRDALEAAGVDATAAAHLIGAAGSDLDLGLSAWKTPPAWPYVEEKAGE